MGTNIYNLLGIDANGGRINSSYELFKWREKYKTVIQMSADALILRLRLYKFMKRRPFTKEDYKEMYFIARYESQNELLSLYHSELFTEDELEEFDRIVQENINFESHLSRVIKSHPEMSGVEILTLFKEKQDVI